MKAAPRRISCYRNRKGVVQVYVVNHDRPHNKHMAAGAAFDQLLFPIPEMALKQPHYWQLSMLRQSDTHVAVLRMNRWPFSTLRPGSTVPLDMINVLIPRVVWPEAWDVFCTYARML